MAVKTVQAVVNGQTHTLNLNSATGKYETTITAPEKSSYPLSGHYYPVTVKAEDVAGNVTTADWSSFTADIGSRYLMTIFGYINNQSHRFALNGCEVLFDSGPKYTPQKYSGIWGFGQSYIVRATENNIRIPTGTACGISYVKI